jgi:hypothetical protein
MDFYFKAPLWDKEVCPNTTALAGPVAYASVKNARVIHVKEAHYRNSVFDGVFLLAEKEALPLPKSGKVRIEVYCCWFGHRLKTRGIKLVVNLATATTETGYSRNVVSNLAKRKA